jgi:hypothetical protein
VTKDNPAALAILHSVPDSRFGIEPIDLAGIIRSTCDTWLAAGRTPAPGDWREMVTADPRLAGYKRPDKQCPAVIARWAKNLPENKAA